MEKDQETELSTTNTRLAAVLTVFGAYLDPKLPLEWVDTHDSREDFLRNREDPGVCKPKTKVTWHLKGIGKKAQQVHKAIDIDLNSLDENLEKIIKDLPKELQDLIDVAVTQIVARACQEVLLNREELVKLLKSVPKNAKWDGLRFGNKVVMIGKCSSPEIQAKYLSRLHG
jgi:hypothetical protein